MARADAVVHFVAPTVQVLWSWLHLFCKFALVSLIEVTAIVALSWILALWGWVFVVFNVNIAICCVVLDTIFVVFYSPYHSSLAMLCVRSHNRKDCCSYNTIVGLLRLQALLLNRLSISQKSQSFHPRLVLNIAEQNLYYSDIQPWDYRQRKDK